MVDARAKRQLLLAVVIALLIVAAAWYFAARQTYHTNATLVRIDYNPTTGAPPYLTFTFAQPSAAAQVAGTTAVLQGFEVAQDSPTPAAVAQPLLAALQAVPFVPTLSGTLGALTSNTLPAGQLPPLALAITGAGSMKFAVPKVP